MEEITVLNLTTQENVNKFAMLYPMLNSALIEMREFSKKKQDGVLNSLKVKLINRYLTDIKEMLADEPSTTYLEILDEDTLPQNSDAVLILGQYHAAMEQFNKKYYRRDSMKNKLRWFTKECP